MEPAADQVAPHVAPGVAGRVPVTIVAGFLGSGKTTLLNRILAGDHGLRAAVFVNDFGAIDVDSRLVTSRDADVIALDNGCICCTIGADLVSRLASLLEGPAPPDRVFVECSGVSDLGRLVVSLRDPYLRRLALVDGVITLLDSAAVDEIPPPALELARRQLASADVIVLNKADLVTPARIEDVRRRFTHPSARVIETTRANVPLEVVLGVGGSSVTGLRHREHDAGTVFTTWSWTSSEPLRHDAVRRVLATLPESVFRAKGFLYLAEAPEQRIVAHVVGRRVDVRPLGPWHGAERRTELVFVGVDPTVDPARVGARLAGAVAVPSWSA